MFPGSIQVPVSLATNDKLDHMSESIVSKKSLGKSVLDTYSLLTFIPEEYFLFCKNTPIPEEIGDGERQTPILEKLDTAQVVKA